MSNLKLQNLSNSSDLNDSTIGRDLRSYSKVCKDLETAEQAYAAYIDRLESTNSQFADLAKTLAQAKDRKARLKSKLEDHCRRERVSLKEGNVSVTYSDPKSISYDAEKLLEIYPDAGDIPRLIKQTVDVDIMEAATAAGMIPEDVEAGCKLETARYRTKRTTTPTAGASTLTMSAWLNVHTERAS